MLQKRYVKITSLSFFNRPKEEIFELAEKELQKGIDMLVLPETWAGEYPLEKLNGDIVFLMQKLALKYQSYIVNPLYIEDEEGRRVNSAVLIDRKGDIAGVYNKYYPFWMEFGLNPKTEIGTEISVFETDFGKVGIAICFDANFPEVWKVLCEKGAEIVIWPSAYSAGLSLQAHAINYNYYIVTSTMCYDCAVYDITGKEVFYQKKERGEPQVAHVLLDMNREIFHFNFNLEKRDRLLAEHHEEVELEQIMEREEWFVLKGRKDNISVKKLAEEYGLEPLSQYKRRSRIEIDRMREKGYKG